MTYPPPYPPQYPPQRKTNGYAIAGFVLSVFGCIPILSSLLAIIFSWIGIRKARDPQYGLRGLAIAGLVIGILGLIAFPLAGAGFYAIWQAGAPARNEVKLFVTDCTNDNRQSAAARTAAGSISDQDLSKIADLLSGTTLDDMTTTNISMNYNNGAGTCTLSGTLRLSGQTMQFTADLVESNNQWKISHFSLTGPPPKRASSGAKQV